MARRRIGKREANKFGYLVGIIDDSKHWRRRNPKLNKQCDLVIRSVGP